MTDLLLMGAGGPAGAGYDTDAEALFTRMAAASDAATDPLKVLINTRILALKSGAISGSNIWNKTDVMASAMLGAASSLLNWKTGSFGDGALVHTSGSTDATFTTKDGFRSNSVANVGAQLIRLAYTPSTQAVAATLNGMSVIHRALSNVDDSLQRDVGQFAAGTGGNINLNAKSGSNPRGQISGSLVTAGGGVVTTSVGLTGVFRTSSSNLNFYHDLTFAGAVTDNSGSLPTQDITILGDNSTADRKSTRGTGGWAILGALTLNEYTDWYNAETAFRAGVAAL